MAIKRCRDITRLNLNYLNNISFCSATHNLVGPYLSLVRGVFPDEQSHWNIRREHIVVVRFVLSLSPA